jgi:hypothetical protein
MMSVVMMAAMLMSFTVNPDGSCKAQVEITIPSLPAEVQALRGVNAPSAENMARQFMRQFVGSGNAPSTNMADAWSDVSLTKTADGSWKFKGTAYIKDITTTHLLPANGRKGGTTWAKDDKGDMVLAMNLFGVGGTGMRPGTMSDAEVAQRMAQVRARLAGKEGQAIEKMMPGMRMEFAFRLPGKVAEVEGFAKGEDGAVRKVIDGAKMLVDLKAMLGDEAQLKASIITSQDPMETVLAKHVGGLMKARVTGEMKPQFDFDAEVKAAKEAFPKMMEKLGLPAEAENMEKRK